MDFPDVLLTQREVLRMTGFRSRTSIYRRTRAGTFPAPLVLGNGAIRWRQSDLMAWIETLPKRPTAESATRRRRTRG